MLGDFLRPQSLGPAPVPFDAGIEQLDEPEQVSVLLDYPGHIQYAPSVKQGDSVERGQPIGHSQGGNFIHASISGTVEKIDAAWSPYSHHVPSAVIKSSGRPSTDFAAAPVAPSEDGQPEWLNTLKLSGVASPWTLTGFNYREEESAALPDIRTVVIKGVHEEPTIFTSQLLLHEESERVREGLQHVAEIAPGATIWLTVAQRDEQWARSEFGAQAKIATLPDHYRGRIERHVVPRLVGAPIPHRAAYTEHGVAVMAVEYLLALRDALQTRQPFVSKCVTVAGDDLERAVTLRVPMGTSIRAILAERGISIDDVGRVIAGGPMKGIAQYTDRTPLTHVDGLYLMSPDSVAAEGND
ncbi:MAG: hypothetical protein JSW51_03680, partial [Gemmatimonadota bacterium]